MECDQLASTSTPSTQMGGGITSAFNTNDLSTATGQTELQATETEEPNLQQRASLFAPSYRSSASFAESYSCPLSQNQYHYIQYPYPAAYYEHINQQTKSSPHPTRSTCYCHCSCGGQQSQPPSQPQSQAQAQQKSQLHGKPCHSHQGSVDSQMSVAVIVHRQAGGSAGTSIGAGAGSQGSTKAQSEQSLLNHSYQALVEEKPLNNLGNSKLNISCDCDLECTCGAAAARRIQRGHANAADVMLAADEITVSESDNNSTIIKKKKGSQANKKFKGSWCTHESDVLQDKHDDPKYNSSQIDIYSDGEGDGDGGGNDLNSCLKDNNGMALVDGNNHRPPLPPRLPPRPRNIAINSSGSRHHAGGIKKYVVWCLLCGGFSCLLGVLFLGVYFLLHSYTITVGNFETVPTFVPATLLILTGLCIMSLARRKNRYSYLIKLSGACGLISALTCALVTVTTTVLHMSRLQALRECEYAQKTRTCTCYSEEDIGESQVDRADKEGVRLVFDSLSDCGVVHGSLYSCLRAIFGLSVAGVLIAVFSCMLVYQLLSHERKKMYWEQLELRCRSLYTSQQGPPPNVAVMGASARGAGVCRCCEQCHAHRQAPIVYPWVADDGNGEPRFWTGQPPGNFYSPNPGSEDPPFSTMAQCRGGDAGGHSGSNSRSRATSGWSWPRMPWQRNSPGTNPRFHQTPSSPDSQYGFSNAASSASASAAAAAENMRVVVGEESSAAVTHHMQPFNIVPAGGYGVWGPPPPYSDPNSPARYYQYIQPNACTAGNNNSTSSSHNDGPTRNVPNASEHHMVQCISHHRSAFAEPQPGGATSYTVQQTSTGRSSTKRQVASAFKLKSNGDVYENTPSDSDCGGARDRSSNTLPTRKMKKRVEAGAGVKSIGPNSQSAQRINVQQVFVNATACNIENNAVVDAHHPESHVNAGLAEVEANSTNAQTPGGQTPRHKRGVENSGFQSNIECGDGAIDALDGCDPSESEVYFADVSSCCNMSVKNDNYYEDTHQGIHIQPQQHGQQAHMVPQHHHQSSSCSHNSSCQEDYLAQRFGQRENSIRSRLPFPQLSQIGDYEANPNLGTTPAHSKTEATAVFSCNHMQKEISRQSMCSVESEAKTEFTDLSPSTPSSNQFTQVHFTNVAAATAGDSNSANAPSPPNFVASFPPYSSESQSLEAHRRTTKNISDMILNAPNEAHYEVINDTTASSNMRGSHKPPAPRPNNLTGSKRHELTPLKSKPKSMSRERLDAAVAIAQPEISAVAAWQEAGGGNDRMRL